MKKWFRVWIAEIGSQIAFFYNGKAGSEALEYNLFADRLYKFWWRHLYLCGGDDDDDDNDDGNDDPDDDFHFHVLPEVFAFDLDGCALELFSSLLKKKSTKNG